MDKDRDQPHSCSFSFGQSWRSNSHVGLRLTSMPKGEFVGIYVNMVMMFLVMCIYDGCLP